MKELKPYIVGFKKNDIIKDKIYLSNSIVHSNDYCSIIIITYNKYIFSANNGVQKTQTRKGDIFS